MKVFSFLFFLFLAYQSHAQNNSVSSGGNAIGPEGSSSYSVGQVVYTNATGSGGSSNQGVQQTYEITSSLGEELSHIQLIMKVYPNPTLSDMVLKIYNTTNYSFRNMNFQLLDIHGKLLYSELIGSSETTISMANLTSSVYFLHIYYENKIIKSFKILKQ
jgi:hypothetical protein